MLCSKKVDKKRNCCIVERVVVLKRNMFEAYSVAEECVVWRLVGLCCRKLSQLGERRIVFQRGVSELRGVAVIFSRRILHHFYTRRVAENVSQESVAGKSAAGRSSKYVALQCYYLSSKKGFCEGRLRESV